MKLVYLSKHFILLLIILMMSSCTTTVKMYEGTELPKEKICILHVVSPLHLMSIDGDYSYSTERGLQVYEAVKILMLPGKHCVSVTFRLDDGSRCEKWGTSSSQSTTFSCEGGDVYKLKYWGSPYSCPKRDMLITVDKILDF